jgi:MFS family permease
MSVPASRRDLVALAAMSFAMPTFQGLTTALVPLRMAAMGLDETTIGLVQALPGLMVLALGAPMAQLANTRYRRRALGLVFLMVGTASALLMGATDATDLILPQLFIGLATCGFYGNMLATTFRLAQGPQQSRIQGRIMSVQGLGYFAGPLLGGYLSRLGYDWGFAPGLLCAALGLASAYGLSPAKDIEERGHILPYLGQSYRRFGRVLTRRPVVLLGVALVSLSSFLFYVTGGAFFLVWASLTGLSALHASMLMSLRELTSSVLRLGFGRLSRVVPPLSLLVAAVIVGALVLSFLPQTETLLGLALVALGIGVASAFVPPALNMLAGASAAPHEQSFAILCLASGHFLVQTILAPVAGWALGTYGYGAVYPVMGGLWAVLALVVLFVGRGIVARSTLARSAGQATPP